jgi:hypothetical protein
MHTIGRHGHYEKVVASNMEILQYTGNHDENLKRKKEEGRALW